MLCGQAHTQLLRSNLDSVVYLRLTHHRYDIKTKWFMGLYCDHTRTLKSKWWKNKFLLVQWPSFITGWYDGCDARRGKTVNHLFHLANWRWNFKWGILFEMVKQFWSIALGCFHGFISTTIGLSNGWSRSNHVSPMNPSVCQRHPHIQKDSLFPNNALYALQNASTIMNRIKVDIYISKCSRATEHPTARR